MIVEKTIGGLTFTATVGPHEGSDVPEGVVRVTGPFLDQPAEFTRAVRRVGPRPGGFTNASETDGSKAIRYTVDNIVLPLLVERAIGVGVEPQ